MISLHQEQEPQGNPLDLLEEFLLVNDWPFERASDSELVVEVEGQWCGHQLFFVWQADMAAIHFSSLFGLRVPEAKRQVVWELLAAVNETLWLGHFELSTEASRPIFRHTLPLGGLPGVSIGQLEVLVDTAVSESERFYPALQLVIWAGRSVEEAVKIAVLETAGSA